MGNHDERRRLIQMFYPNHHRSIHIPQMLQSPRLEARTVWKIIGASLFLCYDFCVSFFQELLEEDRMVQVLDVACVQFEPEDNAFIKVWSSLSASCHWHSQVLSVYCQLSFFSFQDMSQGFRLCRRTRQVCWVEVDSLLRVDGFPSDTQQTTRPTHDVHARISPVRHNMNCEWSLLFLNVTTKTKHGITCVLREEDAKKVAQLYCILHEESYHGETNMPSVDLQVSFSHPTT